MSAKSKINDIRELKCGMNLICPESLTDKAFIISPAVNFGISPDGYWCVDCPICGESHIIDYVYLGV